MNPLQPFREGGRAFAPSEFALPPTELFPVWAWSWVSPMTEARIDEQIAMMERAGIRAFYILAMPKSFGGDTYVTTLAPEYLSDAYFALVRYAFSAAQAHGMCLWLYDEGGWPSGVAAGVVYAADPSTGQRRLVARKISLAKGKQYHPSPEAVAAFCGGERIAESFCAERDCEVEEFLTEDLHRKFHRVGDKPVLFADGVTEITNPRTTELFLELTHQRYADELGELIGGSVSSVFTDEPKPGNPPWWEGIAEEFSARYGYDLRELLPAVLHRELPTDAAGEQARTDYAEFCAARLRMAYFDPIRAWCRAHGIWSVGHIDRDHRLENTVELSYGNALALLRGLDIPGVDVIWRQIFPFADGRCVSDGAFSFFPRMASSAAAQTGGNLALAEVFAVYGAGLSPDEARFCANYLLVRGINLFSPMTVLGGTENHYCFTSRPVVFAELPGLTHLAAFNQRTARGCYLAATGVRAPRPAVLYPWRDIAAGGERERRAKAAVIALGERLEREQVDFDLADEEILAEGKIEDGALTVGCARYTATLIPDGVSASAETRALAARLSGEVRPLCRVTGADTLRVSRRELADGGALYLLFNESRSAERFDLAFPETLPFVRASCADGRLYSLSSECADGETRLTLSLAGGELCALLFTDASLPAEPERAFCHTLRLADFTLRPVWELHLTAKGPERILRTDLPVPCPLGDWRERLGETFSGECLYETVFSLENAPQDAEISLGELHNTAEVTLNGVSLGIAAASPHRLFVPAGLLRAGENRLSVCVANTTANQQIGNPAEAGFSAAELTNYNAIEKKFEAEGLAGGLFGPVELNYPKPFTAYQGTMRRY